MGTGQAEALMPLLEAMLARASLGWRDLAGLGVGTGPGNFTGVRIAVAAARGLALGLGVPAVGVTALEAQAVGVDGPCLSLVDARRGAVYAQALPGGAARLCSLEEAVEMAEPGAICLGHRAAEAAALLGGGVGMPVHPLAVAIGLLTQARRQAKPERPAPFYLRGADAAPPSDAPPLILA